MEPDILLADVILDGITGIEVAIRLGGVYPESRIILFSGQTSTADLLDEAAQQNGRHFEVLAKPVHPDELLTLLQTSM